MKKIALSLVALTTLFSALGLDLTIQNQSNIALDLEIIGIDETPVFYPGKPIRIKYISSRPQKVKIPVKTEKTIQLPSHTHYHVISKSSPEGIIARLNKPQDQVTAVITGNSKNLSASFE